MAIRIGDPATADQAYDVETRGCDYCPKAAQFYPDDYSPETGMVYVAVNGSAIIDRVDFVCPECAQEALAAQALEDFVACAEGE